MLDTLLRRLWTRTPSGEVEAKARLLVADTLACMIAGLAAPPLRRLASTLAESIAARRNFRA